MFDVCSKFLSCKQLYRKSAAVCTRYLCKVSLYHKNESMRGLFHVDVGVGNIDGGCLLIGACPADIIIPHQGDASS